jgi:hypothetical protein
VKKLPVGEAIRFAYHFTFGQLGTIIGLVWIPLVVIAVLQFLPYGMGDAALSREDNAAAFQSAQLRAILFMFVIMLMYACVFVSVTQQALGLRQGGAIYHFALGRTELRMWGSLLLLGAILFMLLAAIGLLTFVGAVAAGKSVDPALAGPVQSAFLFIGACAFIYVAVRLGYLLVPATVVEKKLGFESSWKLSQGNFWRISLAAFVVTLPIAILVFAAQYALMGRELIAIMQPGVSLETFPARLELITARHAPELIGVNLIVAPFVYGLFLATAAFAYRTLSAPPSSPTAVEPSTS